MKTAIVGLGVIGNVHYDVLKNMGVDTTEVFLNTFSEYEKPFVEELVRRKEQMKVHSVHAHGTCFEPELFSSYSRIRDDAESIFKKVCISAFMLGAKYVTFHGPFAKRGRAVNVNMSDFTKRLNELCDVAESCGVSIAYENVNWAYCDTPEFFKAIKEQCPRLKGTLDVKQAIYSGVDVYKFLDVMEDRLVTVHVSDFDYVNERHWLPGEGKIDWVSMIDALDEVGYEGTFLYELSFLSTKTIERKTPLTPAHFYKNATEIHNRSKLTINDTPFANIDFWGNRID